MTQPTVVFFGPDGGTPSRQPRPKVFLRSLLFSTSKRGPVIESLHVRLSRGETRQNFNIWVYGDHDKLLRGSGLFVGETGIATNHHFLLPEDAPKYTFTPGTYIVELFARTLGEKTHRLLFSHAFEVTEPLSKALEEPVCGLYFDWGPDSARYLPHIDRRTLPARDDSILEFLAKSLPEGLSSDQSPQNLLPECRRPNSVGLTWRRTPSVFVLLGASARLSGASERERNANSPLRNVPTEIAAVDGAHLST